MGRFLVCSGALLDQPGSPGATGDLRDCITGVATLLVCVLRRKATAMDSSAKNKLSIYDDVPWDNSSPAPFEGVRSWCKSKWNKTLVILLPYSITVIMSDSESEDGCSILSGATISMHL